MTCHTIHPDQCRGNLRPISWINHEASLNTSVKTTILILSHFFSQGVHDQLYWSPAKLKKHTDDSGSILGALGFTSPVEQLALRAAPAESLLTWLTTPTGPHLVEAVLTSESHTALAILVTPEGLYNSHSPRVGLGLVHKAPYIKTASFSEAFFHLKCTSDAEVDKRITEPNLMFMGINEASKVIPLPYIQPLFLDVPTMSDIMESNKPWSPHAFRAFRLHRVLYTEGSTVRTQVAYPCLGGKTTSYLLNFQKQQLIPELREHSMVLAALVEADDEHWNVTNDLVYPLVWKCSGGGMNPLGTLKQTSLPRGQAQEGEVPQV